MKRTAFISAGCLAALLGTVAFGQTEIPRGDKAVTKWMADNKVRQDADGEDWRRVATTPDGIHMRRVRTESALNAPNAKTRTVVMRLELFEPIKDGPTTISSIAFDWELDCQNKNVRQVLLNAFPQYNLIGKASTEKIDEAWGPVAQNPIMSAVATDVCQDISGNRGGTLGGSHGQAAKSGGR